MAEWTAFVELSSGSDTVRLGGSRPTMLDGYYVTDSGIEGWLAQPDRKTTVTEQSEADGAYPIRDEDLHWSSRTVTLHVGIAAATRDLVLSRLDRLASLAGRTVTVRVVDAGTDTFATGYMAHKPPDVTWVHDSIQTDLAIVCTDPRRYGSTLCSVILEPETGAGGGLVFPLGSPLSFGDGGTPMNAGLLTNAGSATAFPRFTVHGRFPGGIRLTVGGSSVTYVGSITSGSPLVLDALTRTATVGGLDRSQFLGERDFPTIPPGGSITVAFQPLDSTTGGWCVAETRDTFI